MYWCVVFHVSLDVAVLASSVAATHHGQNKIYREAILPYNYSSS